MFNNLKELYRFRALILALVRRHLAMRYRGSVLGFLWSFLNPLCLMGVYVLVFHYYIRFSQVENYSIFLFCGLLPWIWSSSALSEGTSSIVASGHLVTKSMFPPHILPLVAVITSMINFVLSLPLLVLFMLAAGVTIPLTSLALPGIMLFHALLLFGVVMALGALNVHFRDVQHVVANVLGLIFFLCPIVYPAETVPERFRWILIINPLALLTDSYRQVLLQGQIPDASSWLFLGCISISAVIVGNLIFSAYRETFAELL